MTHNEMPEDTVEEMMREIKNIQHAHPLVYERIEQLLTTAYNKGVEVGRVENNHLKGLLKELYAVVKGESPQLLNEDSGGNAELDLAISKALTSLPDDKL